MLAPMPHETAKPSRATICTISQPGCCALDALAAKRMSPQAASATAAICRVVLAIHERSELERMTLEIAELRRLIAGQHSA